MATRFLFHASGSIASPTNPAFDAGWEQTGQAVRLPMDMKAKQGPQTALANSTAITVPITTTQQILCYQFTSNQVFQPVRLGADVLFTMVIKCIESTVDANAVLAFVLRAFSPDGGTALATLASQMSNTGTEFATGTAATRLIGNGTTTFALTATTLSVPWRLVLDLGAHAQAPVSAQTYTLRAGSSAATDFALTSALTTDLNPWCELSVNLNALRLSNYQGIGAQGNLSCSGGMR